LYLEALPFFMRGAVSIPDHASLIRELRLLERRVSRSGRDAVDHGTGGSDDFANAVAGAIRASGIGRKNTETKVGALNLLTGEITWQEKEPPEKTRVRVRPISESQQETFFRF
jgi:hypothetical protein